MATHSSILAWRIPWTEEPGGLQSRGSQRAGHNRVTLHHYSWSKRVRQRLEVSWLTVPSHFVKYFIILRRETSVLQC